MLDMQVNCIECGNKSEIRLTNGLEVYPKRKDLSALPFWICDCCGNFVGCHHKTNTPTRPLGNIVNNEIKKWRVWIHNVLDPIWKSKKLSRKEVYQFMSNQIGKPYHTGEIENIQQAKRAYAIAKKLEESL